MVNNLIFFLMFFSIVPFVNAQQVVTVSGADITGPGGNMSYTVGQVVYETNYGTDGSEAQGVQQPIEIYVYPGVEEQISEQMNVAVYPNPVLNNLIVKFDKQAAAEFQIILYDIAGQVLFYGLTKEQLFSIDMSIYARSVYFLKVFAGDQQIDVFRIVKN